MNERLRAAVGIALAAAALIASGACSGRPEGQGPTAASSTAQPFKVTADQRSRIHVAEAREASFRPTVETTGTVAFNQNTSTKVIAGISGPVARVLVPIGARVEAGEALAEVASPDFAAALSAYRKAVTSATYLRRIADLDHKLFEAGGIPRRDLEQAETDALSAEADREASLAQLRAIGVPPEGIRGIQEGRPVADVRSVVRSPIAGSIVERLITPGQLLQAGTTPCFTVADLGTMWVIANVFDKDLPHVRAGETAVVLSGASAPITGRVDYVGDLVDPDTRAVPVRVVVPNHAGALRNAAYVRVLLQQADQARGILVPTSAVLRDDENLPFVYLENADGSFSRRAVRLGARVGEDYEIAEGLKIGEKVVVEGGLFMQFAQSQ
jgi:cobalt-zinc-cadmium efflux system membrane fusion protein